MIYGSVTNTDKQKSGEPFRETESDTTSLLCRRDVTRGGGEYLFAQMKSLNAYERFVWWCALTSQVCLSVDSRTYTCVTYLSQVPRICVADLYVCVRACVCQRQPPTRTRERNAHGTLRVDVCARTAWVKGSLTHDAPPAQLKVFN